MNKVKSLPKETELIGLHIRIPNHLRSFNNLLNRGYIIGYWNKSNPNLPKRSIGLWLSAKNPKNSGKRIVYPAFLNNLSDVLECQLLE